MRCSPRRPGHAGRHVSGSLWKDSPAPPCGDRSFTQPVVLVLDLPAEELPVERGEGASVRGVEHDARDAQWRSDIHRGPPCVSMTPHVYRLSEPHPASPGATVEM